MGLYPGANLGAYQWAVTNVKCDRSTQWSAIEKLKMTDWIYIYILYIYRERAQHGWILRT